MRTTTVACCCWLPAPVSFALLACPLTHSAARLVGVSHYQSYSLSLDEEGSPGIIIETSIISSTEHKTKQN
uniref:Putative secreted peptide n=1 Tax=Anopheles braziliensis TaxID=58242 RepID=A0A2M3ZTF1_9DIPT